MANPDTEFLADAASFSASLASNLNSFMVSGLEIDIREEDRLRGEMEKRPKKNLFGLALV